MKRSDIPACTYWRPKDPKSRSMGKEEAKPSDNEPSTNDGACIKCKRGSDYLMDGICADCIRSEREEKKSLSSKGYRLQGVRRFNYDDVKEAVRRLKEMMTQLGGHGHEMIIDEIFGEKLV